MTVISMVQMLEESKVEKAKKEKPDGKLSPLEYMLAVMNDENVDAERRDKMAVAAAPFVHPRVLSYQGKRERELEAAKTMQKSSAWTDILDEDEDGRITPN